MRAERAAIDGPAGGAGGEAELVISHLRKKYAGKCGKLAVRDLCLRVGAGECFGFLGVNGAGKSTTFSMLTGATTPSSGNATLRGMSVLTEQDEIRKLVGFCPQHDALEGLLTAREALELYAAIKGVRQQDVESEVSELLAELDLGMFADKPSAKLSGGNKARGPTRSAWAASLRPSPSPSPSPSPRLHSHPHPHPRPRPDSSPRPRSVSSA